MTALEPDLSSPLARPRRKLTGGAASTKGLTVALRSPKAPLTAASARIPQQRRVRPMSHAMPPVGTKGAVGTAGAQVPGYEEIKNSRTVCIIVAVALKS